MGGSERGREQNDKAMVGRSPSRIGAGRHQGYQETLTCLLTGTVGGLVGVSHVEWG